jgi:hypothetical protein
VANTNQAYLLTPLQQGILLESLEARSPGANVTQVLVSLPESLHADAWTHSWEWLARRHDVLRTACRWSDVERPQQEVAADPAVDVVWHDWSARPLSGIEQAWENLLAADRERGFQLEQAPLWRVTTVRIDARQHRVLFTYHHVILDARSQAILLKEVFFAYDQFRAGRQPAIAPALPLIGSLSTRCRPSSPTRRLSGARASPVSGAPRPSPPRSRRNAAPAAVVSGANCCPPSAPARCARLRRATA